MINPDLLRLYKEARIEHDIRRGFAPRAFMCLELARAKYAKGKRAYSDYWHWQRGAGNVTRQTKENPSNNYAWIESTESAGLRFVGYCDEICRSIRHEGWFTSEFQDETYRGAVWQLPARKGVARYIAGYVDPNNEGAAFVSLDIISETGGDDANDSAKRDAALMSDEIARVRAEREREYREEWDAGAQWENLGERIAEIRSETLALLVESRPERRAAREAKTPHICAAIRKTIREGVSRIAELREQRDELFAQYGGSAGFADRGRAASL